METTPSLAGLHERPEAPEERILDRLEKECEGHPFCNSSFWIPFLCFSPIFVVNGWSSTVALFMMHASVHLATYYRRALIHKGVNATGTILSKRTTHIREDDDVTYWIQFTYTVDGTVYENDAWFEVGRYAYESDEVEIKYLPTAPEVCLPRATLFIRHFQIRVSPTTDDTTFCSFWKHFVKLFGVWIVVGFLYIGCLVVFMYLFDVMFGGNNDTKPIRNLTATALSCICGFVTLFVYGWFKERHERFAAVQKNATDDGSKEVV